LDSVEESVAVPAVGSGSRALEGAGQLLEELALLVGQLLRHGDSNSDLLVATAVPAQVRDATLLQADHPTALRAGRHLHPGGSVDGRHLELVSERGLGHVEAQVEEDVIAL